VDECKPLVVGPSAHPAASRHGAFLLRLFLGGRWRAVVVDPHLPISGRATKAGAYTRSRQSST